MSGPEVEPTRSAACGADLAASLANPAPQRGLPHLPLPRSLARASRPADAGQPSRAAGGRLGRDTEHATCAWMVNEFHQPRRAC